MGGMPEYARICRSMPGYARVCKSMPEYCRVLQSIAEYCRVLQSIAEYCRLLQSITKTNLAHLLGPIFGLVWITMCLDILSFLTGFFFTSSLFRFLLIVLFQDGIINICSIWSDFAHFFC